MVYPRALDSGIDPFYFWQMSLDEIVDVVESHTRKELDTLRMQALVAQNQAIQIKDMLVPLLIDDAYKQGFEPHKLWDLYPGVFNEEKEEYERAQNRVADIQVNQSRHAFADAFNQKFKKKGGLIDDS